MLSPRSIAALEGLRRLVTLDSSGLDRFDASYDGFVHSFRLAIPVLPLTLVQIVASQRGWGLYASAMPAPPDGLAWVIGQLLAYVIGWVLFPLLMVYACRGLDRRQNYYRYMVPYNWMQLVSTLIMAPMVIFGASGIFTFVTAGLYFLLGQATILVLSSWLAFHALRVGKMTAIGIVLLDLSSSYLASHLIDLLLHVS